MPFPSPVTETVLLALIAGCVMLVLGLGWLIYLGRGGRPLDLKISGFGIRVELNKSTMSDEGSDDPERTA